MVRRTNEEVLDDLPPLRVFQVVVGGAGRARRTNNPVDFELEPAGKDAGYHDGAVPHDMDYLPTRWL